MESKFGLTYGSKCLVSALYEFRYLGINICVICYRLIDCLVLLHINFRFSLGAIIQFAIASLKYLLPTANSVINTGLEAHYNLAKESIDIYNELVALLKEKKGNYEQVAITVVNDIYAKMDNRRVRKLFMLAVDFQFHHG